MPPQTTAQVFDPKTGTWGSFTPPGTTPAPTVAPSTAPQTGSLTGTMTTPQPPQTTAPLTSSQGATQNVPGAGLDPTSFMNVLNGVKQNFAANNALINAKNLLIKGLFTSPLSQDQIAQLPPDIAQVWNTGNRDAIQLQVAALNERIQGGTTNFSQSVNYLVNGYQSSLQQAEQNKKDALDTIQNMVNTYGKSAIAGLETQYPDLKPYLEQLKGVSTLDEKTLAQKIASAGGTTGSPAYNGDFGATVDLMANTGTTNQQRNQIKTLAQNFIAQGDYASAYALVQQTTGAGLKGSAATTFQQQTNSVGVLDNLKKAIQDYSAQGGDTNIFKGTQDQIQTKIGKLLTDPKYASLAVQLNAAFQNYRLQMTGAAFGPQESAEYAAILPSPGNTLDLNLAKLEGASNYLNSSIESSVKSIVGQGGVEIKKYAEGATPSNSNTTDPVAKLKTGLLPGEILVSREAKDGRHYVAITPDELWATDIKI